MRRWHARHRVGQRLYLQIYLTLLLVVGLSAGTGVTAAALLSDDGPVVPETVRGAAALLVEDLPPLGSPDLSAALDARAKKLNMNISLWDSAGRSVASSGEPLPDRVGDCDPEGWVGTPQGGGMVVRLADGACLGATLRGGHHRAGHAWVVFPLLLGLLAVGCFPVARRITGRLERLQRAVESWGTGDLSTRVPVHGRDEVADLARSFNRAAERIEALVLAQKRVLASASHELRSPLARLRMALALLDDESDADRTALVEGANGDIEELDALIGDVLLAARLDAGAREPARRETVALGSLLVEEATRVGATVRPGLSPGVVSGDPALLRRMLRNLLENARRHGGGARGEDPGIEAWVEADGDGVRVVVADRGPGVAEADRERIFEPFYRPAGHREGADGGVGLGLALVRQIATGHGGSARYVPREGGGSRFEVHLPTGEA